MIHFRNINAKYDEKDLVLKNINFKIKDKEKVFFIGKSGVGKTTLFNCLTNRKIISKGKIIFNNQDILEINQRKYRKLLRSFALISQISTCSEELNVFNNIYKDMKNTPSLLKMIGISFKKTTSKILHILDQLDIFEKAFSKFKDLSGGQKQRVEIAKAIINKHSLIIADEPTSSLDVAIAKKIIQKLISSTETTSLISVHNLELIPLHSRVIAIKNKQIVFDNKKSKLTSKDIKLIYGN